MRNIQLIRRQRGMSLSALAEASGTSAGYLSRIESGKRHPSIAALYNIAAALDVPVSRLLDDTEPGERSIVIRPEPTDVYHQDGLRFRSISSSRHMPDLQVLHIVVDADRAPGESHTHKGIEWIYVCRGAVQISFDDQTVDVKQSESISFPASVPHRLLSVGGEAEILLMVFEHETNGVIFTPH
ncbi:helix-turn-helix domain-containing protein [Actinoallomurus sp. CA-150999]|uniref:helix-turn-helix domain-containing protein n=1 Tax=Actinoallomurus sp. CA-150999 TaxID=3239887 RepID=UPI003D8FB22C